METPSTLIDRLRLSADIWCDASEATLAKLGRVVINDGGFFARLESPGASTTTATLEKFARFLGDAGNWPDGAVPDVVLGFVHAVGITPAVESGATGLPDQLSGAQQVTA